MPNIDELRETYRNMLDDELIQIAVYEAGDLIPAAVGVLHEELRKRNLAEPLGLAVAAQTREWTAQELEALGNRLRHSPCPMCGSTKHSLNVFRITTVHNYWVAIQKESQLVLGCPDCIERAADKAAINCWMALLHSPFWTISAVMENRKAKKAHTVTGPTKEFNEYVLQNLGAITLALKNQPSIPPQPPPPVWNTSDSSET